MTFLPRDDRGLFPARSLNQARMAPWFLAACFMIKKKIIKIQVMLLNHNIVNFRFEDTNLLMKTELTGQKISFVGICFFFVVSCRVLISVFLLRTDMKSFPNWKKTPFTWHCIDLFTSKYE